MMIQNIRFVDLETGNTFDGSSPYIFWMDGEQSTNLIYSKPICFISNSRIVNISIEKNNIFSLINHKLLIDNELEYINGFNYYDINELKCDFLESYGTRYAEYYVHIIYIIAQSRYAGECLTDLYIDGNKYTIGADFYEENEELYINLSNNGLEIPKSIQKALYGTNIHEENYDNITLNRKWKELLSNAWEVVANKGSYKSLFNSLEWFEYGDKIKLCEVWKNPTNNFYFIQEIQQILDNKFLNSLSGFNKTTYLALYHALEQHKTIDGKVVLDSEKNPELQYITSQWSTQDLALKLCMLGNFYETYFMPIHTDLIHSTIEDVVYTNTFKIAKGTIFERSDFVYIKDDIDCNIKDGDIFRLNKVSFQVGPDTLFAQKSIDIKSPSEIIGVQSYPVDKLPTNEDQIRFVQQYYNEIGSIINFSIQIPLNKDDLIKREVLIFKSKTNKGWDSKIAIEHRILNSNIDFSIFCPFEGEYEVKLQFDSVCGNIYTKRVKFNVIDTNSVNINVYKIQNKQILNDDDIQLLKEPHKINNYHIRGRSQKDEDMGQLPIYKQYIPTNSQNIYSNKFKWTGIALNHMIILSTSNNNLLNNEILNRFYFLLTRNKYIICISKIFGFKPSDNISMQNLYNSIKEQIYREDYIFVPEFHKLIPLDNEKIDNIENIEYYTITDEDTLCVIPELSYGKYIDEYDWEFINVSKPWKEPIKLNYIKEPFIANTEKSPLEPGYYTIKFNYRLTNENKINTIILDSAFKKI